MPLVNWADHFAAKGLCILALLAQTLLPQNAFSDPVAKAEAGASKKSTSGSNIARLSPRPIGEIRTRPIELVGEVVDAWCWSSGVMGEGRGEKHKACGLLCVLGGVSSGIVDDKGKLYICAKSKAYKGCAELMGRFVGKRVRVKGWISERGGCSLLKVSDVTELK